MLLVSFACDARYTSGAKGYGARVEEVARLSPEERELWRSLGRVVQRLPRVVDTAMMRATGLSMTEFSVLDALSDAPERRLRISDLAAETGLSISRVSRVVDQLGTRGWCRRVRDDSDGRAALAVLTDDGAVQVAHAAQHHAELARDRVLRRVPAESRGAVVAALDAIADDR
jgi:DNA-binding MarR family transcriptional regulator